MLIPLPHKANAYEGDVADSNPASSFLDTDINEDEEGRVWAKHLGRQKNVQENIEKAPKTEKTRQQRLSFSRKRVSSSLPRNKNTGTRKGERISRHRKSSSRENLATSTISASSGLLKPPSRTRMPLSEVTNKSNVLSKILAPANMKRSLSIKAPLVDAPKVTVASDLSLARACTAAPLVANSLWLDAVSTSSASDASLDSDVRTIHKPNRIDVDAVFRWAVKVYTTTECANDSSISSESGSFDSEEPPTPPSSPPQHPMIMLNGTDADVDDLVESFRETISTPPRKDPARLSDRWKSRGRPVHLTVHVKPRPGSDVLIREDLRTFAIDVYTEETLALLRARLNVKLGGHVALRGNVQLSEGRTGFVPLVGDRFFKHWLHERVRAGSVGIVECWRAPPSEW